MIDIHFDSKDRNALNKVELHGSTKQIIVEAGHAMVGIYQSLRNRDQVAAAMFREVMGEALAPDSPGWDLSLTTITIDPSQLKK